VPELSESTNVDSVRLQKQASAPDTPPTGYTQLYILESDDKAYIKDDDGTTTDLTSVGGGMTSFDLAADSGTAETVEDSNTLTIAGGTGIDTAVGATDTVTVNIADSGVDTTQLADDAVTNAKMAPSAIDTGQLVDEAVTLNKLANPVVDKLLLTATNSSGSSAAAGDVGLLDDAGEYVTTTTEGDVGAWCIVMEGAPNGSEIVVQRRGNAVVTVTGTLPSKGDYLITSTVAGQSIGTSTMRPEIFAVCTANGSGASVEVLLLTGTTFVPKTSENDITLLNGHSDTDFISTISGSPTTTSVVYGTVTTGSEDVLDVTTPTLARMRLHNTTRGTYRLIVSVDTGTNTITTETSSDSWASGDDITIRSQTSDPGSGTSRYFDLDLSQTTAVPVLARGIALNLRFEDSGAANELGDLHPLTAFGQGQRFTVRNPVASSVAAAPFRFFPLPLHEQSFCYRSTASGSGTGLSLIRLAGYYLATP